LLLVLSIKNYLTTGNAVCGRMLQRCTMEVGMNIYDLAANLADEDISYKQVLLSLQTVGIDSAAEDPALVLRRASDLHKDFQMLTCLFPSLPIQRFLHCRRLHDNLSRQVSSGQIRLEANLLRGRHSASKTLSTSVISIRSEAETDRRSMAFALGWVLSSFQKWTPAHSLLASAFKGNHVWEKIEVELLADLFYAFGSPMNHDWNVTKLDAPESLVGWIEGFFSISAVLNPGQPLEKRFLSPIAGAISDEAVSPRASDFEFSEKSIRRPRNWANLTERERLTTHHSAMPKENLARFCKILENAISEGSDGAVEALITSIAILTCRTVDDVLLLPIDKNALESIRVEMHGEKAKFIVWTRNLNLKSVVHQRPVFSIVLPEFVKIPLISLLGNRQEGTIELALPVSETPWAERTFAWIEQHVKTSKASLDRQLKHALPREMYSQGAHSAVIDAFTSLSGIQEPKIPRNPLSFYISHTNHHFHLTYVSAVAELFGKYGTKKHSYLFQKPSHPVDSETNGSVLAHYFLQKIEAARTAKDKREEHNWLARYTLLLLIAATAHRRSRTPFFFPHDFLLEEKLAFICDKSSAGSEARFVPLAEIALHQLKEYYKHLALNGMYIPAEVEREKNPVKQNKSNDEPRAADTYQTTDGAPSFLTGLFFTIDENGCRKQLATKDIQTTFISEKKLEIKAFRSQLLTWLAEQGTCGFDIEALAGHNRNLHIFGQASTWCVTGWADRLGPRLDQYLKESGWQLIKCNISGANASKVLKQENAIPSFSLSSDAYEGRNRLALAATQRARSAIATVLNREFLEGRDWRLDNDGIDDVEKQLLLNLSGDSDALFKVRRELAAWKSRVSASVEVASIPSFNFIVGEKGPVDIGFSRHHAIASQLKSRAVGRLGQISPDASLDEKVWERISQIAFCLIVFDCILNQQHLWAFIEAIVADRTYRVAGHLAIRAHVEDRPHRFEKEVILSPITAAQIVGLYQLPFKNLAKADIQKQIQTRVSAFVVRMIGRQPKPTWSVNDLVAVFKPFWFVRVPGSLYAVATGQTRGPALDLISEVALFYGATPVRTRGPTGPTTLLSQVPSSDSSNKAQTRALQELKNLFKDVRGVFELGEATRKKQNVKLRKALSEPPSSDMVVLLRDRQIVGLVREFADYMKNAGGLREKSLSAETIRDYLFTVADKLIEMAWDVDLTAFDAEQFMGFYQELKLRLKDRRHLGTVIPLFHRFLQHKIDAPYVPGIGLGLSVSVSIRASILTPGQFDMARGILLADKTAQPWEIDLALQLLESMYGYGVRSREASGLTARHVIGTTPHKVIVRPNRIRSIKSRSPRVVWSSNLSKTARRHFDLRVEEARLLKPKDQPLFEDTQTDGDLYLLSLYSNLLTEVLRTVTGNDSFVNYNLRHSFVTAVVSAVMPTTDFSDICNQSRNAILRDLDVEGVWDPIKGGCNAWPFGLELVAMMAGHESSVTTSGSYWHVSHYNLHSFTEREFASMNLSDRDVASMLGVSPSAVSQSISKEGSEPKWLKQRNTIYDRVRRLRISSAIKLVSGTEVARKKKDMPFCQASNMSPSPPEIKVHWDRLNLLLCVRQKSDLSLEAFKDLLVSKHGFTVTTAALLVNTYEEVLNETGFDDFEPASNALTAVAPKFSQGVWRGLTERRRFLAAAQHSFLSQASNLSLLQSLCDGWRTHVFVDRPFLVANSPVQAVEYAQALTALGIKPTQILAHVVNYSYAEIKQLSSWINLEEVTFGNTRVSRGHARTLTHEIGFNVKQLKGSEKPDGRDLHRALFVLTIALTLWTAKTA
jgi:hypothetical protein